MEQEKTIKEVKFEKAWACAMLVEIRDALKDGRTLKATTKWEKTGDEFTLLETLEAVLDNVGADEAMAEQDAKWALQRIQHRAAK